MPNSLTALACPLWNSKLQIIEGVDCFACAHGEHEQTMQRERYIIDLESIDEDTWYIRSDVNKIWGGVDKTAAELAVDRLTKELNELEGKLNLTMARNIYDWLPRRDSEKSLIFLLIFLVVFAAFSHSLTVWSIAVGCSFVGLYLCITHNRAARAMKQQSIKRLDADIAGIRTQLAKRRQLV